MASVSVLIPACNAGPYIKRAVMSALDQDIDDLEVIVIENGVTDNTDDVLREIRDDRLKIRESEKGVSKARNLGIREAKGDWIVFLDADDELLPGSLDLFSSYGEKYGADLVSGLFEHMEEKEREEVFNGENRLDFISYMLTNPTSEGTVICRCLRRDFLIKNEIYFDESLTHAEDTLFLLEAAEKAGVIVRLNRHTYRMHHRNDSVTYSKAEAEKYIPAIRRIRALINDKELYNSYYLFVLNQILILLVHKGFRTGSIRKDLDYFREISKEELFSEAIEKARLTDELGSAKRLALSWMKKGRLFLLWIAVNVRQRQNENMIKKGDRT